MGSHSTDDRRRRGGFGRAVKLAVVGLTVAAVVKELRKESDARTWNGVVAGFVPYDFRVPTLERFKERVWAPDAEHLLGPRVFGIGWTVNLGRVARLVDERLVESGPSAG